MLEIVNSFKRYFINLFLALELVLKTLLYAFNYFTRESEIPSLNFFQHVIVFIIRNVVETPFRIRISTVRTLFAMPKQSVPRNVALEVIEIPSHFRELSEKLMRKYYEQNFKGEYWLDESMDWRKTGPLKAHWLVPKEKKLTGESNVFMYTHGGAFMFGEFSLHYNDMGRVAAESGCAVFGLDYRLGPEYVAPCQQEDTLAAILYLTSPKRSRHNKSGMGFAFNQIAIGGDSAGGNVAASTIHVMRDLGMPTLAGAVLQSPYLDMTHSLPSHRLNEDKDVLGKLPLHPPSRKFNEDYCDFPWQLCYLLGDTKQKAGLTDRGHAYCKSEYLNHRLVSPVYDTDFSGLPPMLIQVGACERFRDESILYAQNVNSSIKGKAREGSKLPPATLYVYEDMPHCFNIYLPNLQSEWLFGRMSQFLRQCFPTHGTDASELARVKLNDHVRVGRDGFVTLPTEGSPAILHRTDQTQVPFSSDYKLKLLFPRQ